MSAVERDPQAPEIRAWGKENGWEIEERGRIPAALRSAWATANAGGAARLPEAAAPAPNGHGPVTFTIPDFTPPGPPEDLPAANGHGDGAGPAPEQPPAAPPKQSRREQIAERFRRRPAAARPRPRRRVTLETLGGLVWTGAAQLCAKQGKFLPVANIMAFQAPVAGLVLEDALKNTMADAVLQPVARLVESGSTVGSLVGPPALVAVVCVRPELYPVARPLLAAAIKEWIITAGPKLRQLRQREEKFTAEMAELTGEDMTIDIDEMIDMVFAPLFADAAPGPDAYRSGPPPAPGANGHPGA